MKPRYKLVRFKACQRLLIPDGHTISIHPERNNGATLALYGRGGIFFVRSSEPYYKTVPLDVLQRIATQIGRERLDAMLAEPRPLDLWERIAALLGLHHWLIRRGWMRPLRVPRFAQQRPMPESTGDTITFRRHIP